MSQTTGGSAPQSRLRYVVRALRHRNYRLFFIGQGISLIGTWMQIIATSWLINRLTGSAFLLGVNTFANRIPSAVFTPLAGVWIDRSDKHRLVIWCQLLAMLQALVLAALALHGSIQVWQVLVLSAGLGVVGAVEVPARQAFFVELVEDRDDLSNAIALNSTLFNSARLVGPAVAGALIAAFSEGVCFLLNGVSYLAVIAALLLMKVAPDERPTQRGGVWAGLTEGWRYAFGFPPIRALMALVALTSLCGMAYQVVLPVFAEKIVHSNSRGFGLLMACAGFGAMSGALYLAQRRGVLGLGRLIPRSLAVFSLGVLGLSLSHRMGTAVVAMVVLGAGMMVQMASCNTLVQTIVDDDKRGRVMSLYVVSFMGMMPLGSLLSGWLADHWGVPLTLQLSSAVLLLGGFAFHLRLPNLQQHVHPVYVEKGIVPEVASGVQSASRASLGYRL